MATQGVTYDERLTAPPWVWAAVLSVAGVSAAALHGGAPGWRSVVPYAVLLPLAVAGLLVALAVAFVPTAFGRAVLQHSPGPGAHVTKVGSLELITAVLFDVGIMLLVVGVVVAIIHGLATAGDLDDDVGQPA